MIFLSQQLATRRNLHARQTLTATHDNMSAWTWIGSRHYCLYGARRPSRRVLPGATFGSSVFCLCCCTAYNDTRDIQRSAIQFEPSGDNIDDAWPAQHLD